MSQSSHQVRRLAHLTGVLLFAGAGIFIAASPAAAVGGTAPSVGGVGEIVAVDRGATVPPTLGSGSTQEHGLVENAVAGTEATAGSSSQINFTATPAVSVPDTSSSNAVLILACAGLLLLGAAAYGLAHGSRKKHRTH